VLKALDTAIAVTRPDGEMIFANAPLSDLTGMPLATMVGSPVFTLFDHERRDELERLHAAALTTSVAQRADARALSGTDTTFSARVVMRRCDQPDGHYIVWCISDAGSTTPKKRPPVANSGLRNLDPRLDLAPPGTEIGLRDWDIPTNSLTWINKKNMEAALRKAEDRYDLAINAAQLPVWEYDQATDTVTGNIYWHRAVGHDLTEAEARQRKETWLSDIHPEDIARHQCVYRDHAVDDNGLCQSEFRIKLPNGDYRWLLDRARVVERAADGQPLKVVGISVDIDAQKRLQAALREGEARLETAIGGSDIGLWDWAVGSGALRWLSDWPLRKGLKATLQPSTYPELLASTHPEDRKRLDADARAVISGGRDVIEMDYRFQSLQGEWLWVQFRAKVVERDRRGRAQRIVGACIDVDARRRAEEMLRTQATILETMREGIVLIDVTGCIELSNPAFDRMVGYPAGGLAGCSIGTLLSGGQPGQPQRIIERLVEALRNQTGACDILFRRRDGTEFTGEVVTAAIALASGKRWLAVVQDVSERKRLEQEVLDIANRERRRFGHELHDGLCQELTGVALMLRSIATHLRRNLLPTHRQIEDLIALVTGAIDSARAMAHGLSPVTLDRGGLVSALSALAHRARESYGVDVRLRSKVSPGLTIDEATASHLYRIAQEAINNAAKHGHARAITVTLQAHDDKVQLSVSDDGIGLPDGAIHGPGMGLKIMAYRARMINGVVDVAPRRGGGTRVQCVCPAPSRRPQGVAGAMIS